MIEKLVVITAMAGGSKNEDNAAIPTQVPDTTSITGKI